MKKIISTQNAPAAIGPYSQAVISGDFLFVSGQIPLNPATGLLVDGDIAVQTHQIMKNITAIAVKTPIRFILPPLIRFSFLY